MLPVFGAGCGWEGNRQSRTRGRLPPRACAAWATCPTAMRTAMRSPPPATLHGVGAVTSHQPRCQIAFTPSPASLVHRRLRLPRLNVGIYGSGNLANMFCTTKLRSFMYEPRFIRLRHKSLPSGKNVRSSVSNLEFSMRMFGTVFVLSFPLVQPYSSSSSTKSKRDFGLLVISPPPLPPPLQDFVAC